MEIKTENSNPTSSLLILFSLMFLGIGLRFYGLNHILGGGDENEVLMYYVYKPISFIVSSFIYNYHHVFHTILLHFMAQWFGELNEYAIRAPAFLSGIATLWLVYKVSQKMFASLWVARLSLLIMALSPIHIYYSQTARGYSLSIFISILMIYALIRFFESGLSVAWAFLLAICGFLITYTIPLNALFVIALGIWAAFVTTNSRYGKGFDFDPNLKRKRFLYILCVFVGMALLSLLAYSPLLKDMLEIAGNRYLKMHNYSSRIDLIIHFFPNLIKFFFPGSLIFFTPFIAIGLFKAKPVLKGYRLLPIFVVLTIYLISVISFVVWFPRSYLFTLPLLVIFLSAGLVFSVELAIKFFPNFSNSSKYFGGIIIVYILLSFKWLLPNYYLSNNLESGKKYLEFVSARTHPLDLIVIGSPMNYLYSRYRYKENLKNIFFKGEIEGIKFIASNIQEFDDMTLPGRADNEPRFPVFRDFFKQRLKSVNMPHQKQLYSLTGEKKLSVLSEDFEVNGNFVGKLGTGRIVFDKDRTLSGSSSLGIVADSNGDMVFEKPITQMIDISEESLAVLVWGEKFANREFGFPLLRVNFSEVDLNQETPVSFKAIKPFILQNSEYQLRTGLINNGIGMELLLNDKKVPQPEWAIRAVIGKIPPGRYRAKIEFFCPKGQMIHYDGIRLFFVEKSKEITQDSSSKKNG